MRQLKKRRTVIGLLLLIVIIGAVPASRYFVLNLFGVRGDLSVRIVDKSTNQPLKNVDVAVHGFNARTDDEGRARFEDVRLGRTELQIDRYAFAPVSHPLTVGWGDNILDELELTPTGVQFSFMAVDYLSGRGVDKIEAARGPASAFSDKNGEIVLTVEDPEENIDITVKGEGYRDEKFTISRNTEEKRRVRLVPGRYHSFISRRSGTADLYKIYADGRGEKVVLKGTGSERGDMTISPHPAENIVALMSARGNQNSDGFLLSNLNLVNLETNEVEEIAESERIQVVGWVKDRLIYVRIAEGVGSENPKRHRLISYDYKTKDTRELAAANLFNDVLLLKNKIYYAPSRAYQDEADTGLFQVNADGGNRKNVLNREVWNLFRGDYDIMDIAVAGGEWYSFAAGARTATKLSGEPEGLTSRVYVDSPDGKSLWTDRRDGNHALMLHDIETGKDEILQTQTGLDDPVGWLNAKTAVYRVRTEQETADYAISLDGGQPVKIRDVADMDELDSWYYY